MSKEELLQNWEQVFQIAVEGDSYISREDFIIKVPGIASESAAVASKCANTGNVWGDMKLDKFDAETPEQAAGKFKN